MKHELFVAQPSIDLKEGIKVSADTEITYSNDKVTQELKNLVLKTSLEEHGTNGINSYVTKSEIHINLNGGDILLFDKNRGYYLPAYSYESIEDAISDIESLRGLNLTKDTE